MERDDSELYLKFHALYTYIKQEVTLDIYYILRAQNIGRVW